MPLLRTQDGEGDGGGGGGKKKWLRKARKRTGERALAFFWGPF